MEGIFERKNLKFYIKKVKGFWGFEPMFHSHMEIIHVLSGSIDMSINGCKKTVCAGETSITFPYCVHSYAPSDEAEAVILMFDPSIAEVFEKKLLSHNPRIPYVENSRDIPMLLEKILQYAAVDTPEYFDMARIYLLAVIGEILFSLELVSIEGTDISTVQKILIYCAEHYTEEITLKSISQSLYVSQSTITKIFSQKLACSFRDYINRLRISKAKYELEKTDRKIIDIMYACGFKNQSSFNRAFLEICDSSPNAYRKNHRKNMQS